MRHTKLIALSIAVSAFLAAQTDPPGRVGRLNYISGAVSFQPAGVTDWVDADINRPLTTGDQVWIGAGGRAEIHVGSTSLRLDSNTAFQFLNLDDRTIQIQLSEGSLAVHPRSLDEHQNIEIDTPSLAFTVLRSGDYRIDANSETQTTKVIVRTGDGEVTGGGQAFSVHGGQQAIVTGGDQITYNLVSAPGSDGWDAWNASRDRVEDGSASARYVSREMVGYEDLDRYGGWADQPGYGQVWMPSAVEAGWAPYSYGEWVWIAPWGWTWVDAAPWGFAPYHYGRWASFGGRWGWVPGPYGVTPLYAPALVGWIGGGSGFSLSFSGGSAAAIGWFPLGPREPYFPAYNASSAYFGRLNNTNTVISVTAINSYYSGSRNANGPAFNNVQYANRNVQNAVTAVPQDRFANGHRVAESSRPVTGAQLGGARFAAAPNVAPQHVSVLGARAGEASNAPRPPAAVMSRPVVARTAPPPAAAPFDRQQSELNRNPGRPLPPASVQQSRQDAPAGNSAVHVIDMGRVQRVQPAVGAGPQPGGRGTPNTRTPNTQRTNEAPPAVESRPSPFQSNPVGRQNGRGALQVVRPDAAPPNANPQRQNAPPTNAAPQPVAAPPPAVNIRPSETLSNPADRRIGRGAPQVVRPDAPPPNASPQRQSPPPPNVAPQPASTPPPTGQNRNSETLSNPGRSQNGRGAPQVVRPDAQPSNPSPPRQSAPQPNVEQRPNPAPPPPANNRPSAPPPSQQPAPRERAAPPPQPDRPPAQNPQRQPPATKQAPADKPQPASHSPKTPDKPDKGKNDKKQ